MGDRGPWISVLAAAGDSPAGASNSYYCWDGGIQCAISNRRYGESGRGGVLSGNGGV